MDSNLKQDKVTEVIAGDRIDTIANRVLGNPYDYSKILKLNPGLDIWNPQPGSLIRIPNE